MRRKVLLVDPRQEKPGTSFAHHANIAFSAYLVITSTLFFGAFFGDTIGIGPPFIGNYALLVGALHVLPLYVALKQDTIVRINPYISLVEFIFGRRIDFVTFLFEIIAQAAGAALGALSAWGVMRTNPQFIAGFGSTITNTTTGWAFFLSAVSGALISWVYFSRHGDHVALVTTLSATVALSFPFIGTTTHNPYRWLSACIVEQTCGSTGSWVFPTGPLVGVFVGWVMYWMTRKRKTV